MKSQGKDDPFVANRRLLLAQLIESRFEGTQAKLIEHIARKTGRSINQGELSGLLNGKKSFGDKKGRKLADDIGLPKNYFEQPSAGSGQALQQPTTQMISLSAREELVVELFRLLEDQQKDELVTGLRAFVAANDAMKKFTGGKLRLVGNRRMENTFGLPSPSKKAKKIVKRKPHASTKPRPREPGTAADDFMDE